MRFKPWLKRLSDNWFPAKLPTGRQEFYDFCNDIFERYDFPKEESYYHAIAQAILHLGPQTSHFKKDYFVRTLMKSQCNQVAFHMIQELKETARAKEELAQSTPIEGDTPSEQSVV